MDLGRVKVCCIKTEGDIDLASAAGVDVLGFVSEMPSGPGVITLDAIKMLVKRLRPNTSGVLLTSEVRPGTISEQIDYVGSTAVQLVRPLETPAVRALRGLQPKLTIVVVVHVIDASTLQYARQFYDVADYLLLDTGDFTVDPIELGGTGRRHDWTISRRISDDSPIPVFLAGGLNSDNVGEAMSVVNPYGVDVCTGVRENDRVSQPRLAAFLRAIGEW